MNLNTVNLILWAPFALVGLLAALVYCIQGVRKGVKPALVSLAAIFAAAGLGIVLARLLAGILAPQLQARIPSEIFADMGAAAGMMELLVLSVISTLAALVIFMALFLLLTPILAAVGRAILRRTTEPAPATGGSRAAGAAIGLASAFLYALVFLLPIYGSLAAYAPVVRDALDMLPEETVTMEAEAPAVRRLSANTLPMKQETAPAPYSEQQLLRDILDCILRHPLVELSSTAPARQMYSSLSQVSSEQAPVNLADMAGTLETLMDKVNALMEADGDARAAAGRDLVAFCRQELLTRDWIYGVYAMAMEQMPGMLADMEPEIREMAGEALEILTLSEREFQANAAALLDFAEACMTPEALGAWETKNLAALRSSGLLAASGKLLNATEQMAALKNLFYRTMLVSAAEGMEAQAEAFADKYPLGMLTDPAQQEREAEAFCILAGMSEDAEPMEFFLVHPTLGQSILLELGSILGILG